MTGGLQQGMRAEEGTEEGGRPPGAKHIPWALITSTPADLFLCGGALTVYYENNLEHLHSQHPSPDSHKELQPGYIQSAVGRSVRRFVFSRRMKTEQKHRFNQICRQLREIITHFRGIKS